MTAVEHIVASAWLSIRMWRATLLGLVIGLAAAEIFNMALSPSSFVIVKESAVSPTVTAGTMMFLSIEQKPGTATCYASSQRYMDGTHNGRFLHVGLGLQNGTFIDPIVDEIYEIGVLVPDWLPPGHWKYYAIITSHYKFWRFCIPFLELSQRVGGVEVEVLPRIQ